MFPTKMSPRQRGRIRQTFSCQISRIINTTKYILRVISSPWNCTSVIMLTHWGRLTHICVSKLTNIASDNGLSPGRRQTIIRTNAGMLLIGTLGTNFSDILSEIQIVSFEKMYSKMAAILSRSQCVNTQYHSFEIREILQLDVVPFNE